MATQKSSESNSIFDSLVEVINRFSEILPTIPSDPESKMLVSSESVRLRSIAKLIFTRDSLNQKVSQEYVGIINLGVNRLNILINTLETDSLLGVSQIPWMDDNQIFQLLRGRSKEDLLQLFNWLVAEPGSLKAHERIALHSAISGLGVAAGLGIGVVGWIKLILVLLLVILLIISLFKPELLPAITALAAVLAAIDAVGDKQKPGAQQNGGQTPPPQTPPPPKGKSPSEKIADLIIREYKELEDIRDWLEKIQGHSVDREEYEAKKRRAEEIKAMIKGKEEARDAVSMDDAPSAPSVLKDYLVEHCEWVTLYPDDGNVHEWRITLTGTIGGGGITPTLDILTDAGSTTARVGQQVRIVSKRCRIHLSANRGDKGSVSVDFRR